MAELAMPTTLDSAVVRLRAWRIDDVPEQLMGFADETVQRFSWDQTRPYTEADARDFFIEQETRRLRGEELSFAFVRPTDDRTVLGGGSIYAIDLHNGRAAIGYWLTAAARGHGFASAATRIMARYALTDLQIARLELTCGPDNAASQAVAERCGFTREGVLRAHLLFKGHRRDTVMYSVLPGEVR